MNSPYTFYEFFAGGGMVRAGLGQGWRCLFANDFDHRKCSTYKANWGDAEIKHGDVRDLSVRDLPGSPDLVWASFPCQDLSLAGGGAGLKGERSGTFWPFWDLMKSLMADGRAPTLITLENVCGTLTSHQGRDFAAICEAFSKEGYKVGAVVIDAAYFVPQSRPRLFFIGIHGDALIPEDLVSLGPADMWHTRALKTAYKKLDPVVRSNWLWWNISTPAPRSKNFSDFVEENPESVKWHSAQETKQLLAMMSEVNLEKVREAKRTGRKMVGTIYKRTRRDEFGRKVQRAEVRFDGIAGCLRTPAGGSSRQLIIVVEGKKVRSRLISTLETARLMGLEDSYILPQNYNEAYHLTGDGVVAPVVSHLASHVFRPLLILNQKLKSERAAA